MKVGLIDVDGHNYPNLPLMKLSAWHKAQGDSVEWYEPMFTGHCDRVYMSKVFSFTPDYAYPIDADEIIKGGTGYCFTHDASGKEVFHPELDHSLPYEIEHIYPDYSIYNITDTAYGFLTRGCPRGCQFCIVGKKEGLASRKVADLSEFWRGQKNIVLNDPNILACPEWKNLLQQLTDSRAWVDFNQGLDIRLMTKEKATMLSQIKMKEMHFAWDRYADKDRVLTGLNEFKTMWIQTGRRWSIKNKVVYTLCNFDTTFDQDLDRVYALRELEYYPYIMLYNKELIPRGHRYRKLQRWVNNRFVFNRCGRFEDYTA